MASADDRKNIASIELGDVRRASIPQGEESDDDISVKDREIGSLLDIDLEQLDPAFTYRWARKSPLRIARMKAKGYTLVDPDSEEVKNIVGDSVGEHADGTVTVGDVVLMKIQKKQYRGRRSKMRKFGERRLGSVKKTFKKLGEKAGVEVISDKEE